MKTLVFLVALLAFCGYVSAAEVGEKVYLDYNVTVSFDGSSSTGVNVVEGVIYVGSNGSATFEGLLVRRGVNTSFAVLNEYRETPINAAAQSVYERLEPETIIRKQGGDFLFSLYIRDLLDVFDLKIVFTENADIKEISSSIPYRRLGNTLVFNKTGNYLKTEIDVIYSENPAEASPWAVDTEGSIGASNTSTYVLIILLLCVALMLAYVIRRKKPEEKKTMNEDILQTLSVKERDILVLLLEAGGRETQARLRQKSGMPKSTLSNLLRDMEQKKLVNRYDSWLTKDIEIDSRVYKK